MNRMNVLIAAIGLAALFAIGHAQTEKTQPDPIGRYQLQVVEHDVSVSRGASSAGSVTVKDVVRLDTATGQSDAWRSGIDPAGQPFSDWSPIR
jgi:hypothetical protein